METKVLLINPPMREYTVPSDFPIGLAYVGSYLLKSGFGVDVLDINRWRYSENAVEAKIKETDCKIIAINSFITLYKYTKWLTQKIRELKPGLLIVLGNSLPTTMADFIKDTVQFDYLVLGEGEETTSELVKAIETGADIGTIKGIAYWKDGKFTKTESRPLLDIDTIPFPAWQLFDMAWYTRIPHGYTKHRKTMKIVTARGCPYRCKYCYHIYGYKPRQRSVKNIINEIKELNKGYDVRYIMMADDLFTLNKEYVADFCNTIKKELPWLEWGTSSRINLLNEETIAMMKDAGCNWIAAAIESGSQRIMNEMLRGTTVEQGDAAITLLKKYKIWGVHPLMIGFPTEDEQSIRDSIEFAKRNQLVIRFNFVCPYPGTPLFDDPEIKKRIGNMEDFMMRIGDGRDFVVNLTKFSDKEIFEMRRKAEQEISFAYAKNHWFLALMFSPALLLGKNLAEVIQFYQVGQLKFILKAYIKHMIEGTTKKTEFRVKK